MAELTHFEGEDPVAVPSEPMVNGSIPEPIDDVPPQPVKK